LHQVHLPAVDAARRAGVKHIFYSSLAFAGDKKDVSLAGVMQAHLATERHLAAAATSDPTFTYTAVREGLYAESYPIYTAFFNPKQTNEGTTNEICIPHDGSGPGIAWVKRDELGEATAKLIAQYASNPGECEHANAKVLFTGPQVWTLADTVKALSKAFGKDITIRQVSVDAYVQLPQVSGYFGTEEMARTWATAWDGIRAGETAVVTTELEGILGRKPEEFDVAITS
jgi:uncharacterized protein YbjT (DUF2867 family)